ncbi:uncharacterized protein LOC134786569 [Penaeus indicus]|uniref:uncharacterized protein LOC134786569 n=1 Tax=Penaeus indicus TaxID=29960 RepID=UPI00300C86E2
MSQRVLEVENQDDSRKPLADLNDFMERVYFKLGSTSKHIHVHLTPLVACATESRITTQTSTMNTLTILLVAAVAVVASGMKHPKHSEIHSALHEAKQICMEILMPSEEEMSGMKEKMKECLGNEGHTHLTSHPVLASDTMPNLKHALCFREELKAITAESRRKLAICAVQDHGILDGEELNVPKVMEMIWTKINATQNAEAREYLSKALSELPELSTQPDMLHFIEVKKSLMNSCVMNMAMSIAEEALTRECPGQN